MMRDQTLTEKLINIFERDCMGPDDPDAEKAHQQIPQPSGALDYDYYPVGTVFYNGKSGYRRSSILARIAPQRCMLICLPEGNRCSDYETFQLDPGEVGIKKSLFHEAFKDEWEVSRRGKEALEEWARTDV